MSTEPSSPLDRPDRRLTRRTVLRGAALGMAGLGLRSVPEDPLAPRSPQHPARAKRVIFLFFPGGMSHVDTFDPKPELARRHGQKHGKHGRKLKAPLWPFQPRGVSGTEVSDLFPHIGACIDEIAVLRSVHTDHGNHFEATLGMHTGSVTFTRPSLGAWVSLALGSENPSLPPHVVIAPRLPYAGGQCWSADFLPACHQGMRIAPGPEPVPNLRPQLPPELQRLELDLLRERNEQHLARVGDDSALRARIASFETAAGMQQAGPEAFDLSAESDATHELYGLQRGRFDYGWQCLVARRLVERGVRFVEVIDAGASRNWDSHGDMRKHVPLAQRVDRRVAGLLVDLKQRGLLQETLVVWATEFGRTPWHDRSPKGRSHWPRAFSCWMAGGGVKGGIAWGETDEIGASVVKDGVHVHDLHATILHCLGFDHTRLTYRHAGRDFRLTDVAGRVVRGLLA